MVQSNADEIKLVFQYGSNCSDAQINSEDRLKGDAGFQSIAETVKDYELTFDVFSVYRNCAAADIVAKPGAKAWGVLYEIREYLIGRETAKAHGRKSLDAVEGEGANYERKEIDVRMPDGQIVPALTYTVIMPRTGLVTSLDYVLYIIAGLHERGIPTEYIDKIKRIAAANNPGIAAGVEALVPSMDMIRQFVPEALSDFRKVAAMADAEFIAESIIAEYLPKPHKPTGLPSGKMAVYAFFLNGQALKVGKVGTNSDARFRSQHYNPKSAGSNLARSILANPQKIGAGGVNELNVGDWIKQHTDRVNLFAPATFGEELSPSVSHHCFSHFCYERIL
ncbi:MAG: gamma-glutamylcyclotransferase family protein [Terracidiphilus sp.]